MYTDGLFVSVGYFSDCNYKQILCHLLSDGFESICLIKRLYKLVTGLLWEMIIIQQCISL